MDSFDFAILDALQQDARISNKELAAHIGLAPSTCLGRVRQLEQRGIIQRYVTELDPNALGISLQAMLAIRIRVHSNRLFRAFSEYVLGLPEVRAVYHDCLCTRGDDVVDSSCCRSFQSADQQWSKPGHRPGIRRCLGTSIRPGAPHQPRRVQLPPQPTLVDAPVPWPGDGCLELEELQAWRTVELRRAAP
jgi:hypothetical protein